MRITTRVTAKFVDWVADRPYMAFVNTYGLNLPINITYLRYLAASIHDCPLHPCAKEPSYRVFSILDVQSQNKNHTLSHPFALKVPHSATITM